MSVDEAMRGAPIQVALWLAAAMLTAVVILSAVFLVRLWILSDRNGRFPVLLFWPSRGRWIHGSGKYGRSHLEWRRLYGIRLSADLTLARRDIDLEEVRHLSDEADQQMLTLATSKGTYSFVLSSGDASGVISWIDSAPPGE